MTVAFVLIACASFGLGTVAGFWFQHRQRPAILRSMAGVVFLDLDQIKDEQVDAITRQLTPIIITFHSHKSKARQCDPERAIFVEPKLYE